MTNNLTNYAGEIGDALIASKFAGTVLAFSPETETHYATGLEIIPAEQAGHFNWIWHNETHNDCDDVIGNDADISVYKYNIANCVVFFISESCLDDIYLYPAGTTFYDLVSGWDYGDMEPAEFYESLGMSGLATLSEVDPDFSGEVCIWWEPNYYQGTLGAPTASFVYEDEQSYARDKKIFPTYAEAQEWIDDAESGIYYLAHGEADRPTYTIVES